MSAFPFGGPPANPLAPMPVPSEDVPVRAASPSAPPPAHTTTHEAPEARAAAEAVVEAAWQLLRDLDVTDGILRQACQIILDHCRDQRRGAAQDMLRLLERIDG